MFLLVPGQRNESHTLTHKQTHLTITDQCNTVLQECLKYCLFENNIVKHISHLTSSFGRIFCFCSIMLGLFAVVMAFPPRDSMGLAFQISVQGQNNAFSSVTQTPNYYKQIQWRNRLRMHNRI